MKANVNNTDRLIRFVLAAVCLALFFSKTVTGILGTVILIAGIVLAVTGLVRFCPAYKLLGCKKCCGGKCSSKNADGSAEE